MTAIAYVAGRVRARPIAAHLTLMGSIVFSAGVHAGLVAAHWRETPLLGASFAASAVLLTGIGVALGMYPASVWPPRLAALTFFAQILAYFTFTERITDPLGIATKLVEALGMVVALAIEPTPELEVERRSFAPVYVLLVAFAGLVALEASGHHH
ncbi:MAG: hypothetical protein ACXWYS_04975 [Gaiellaceae bacterium]